jgi:cell division septation protein DedD
MSERFPLTLIRRISAPVPSRVFQRLSQGCISVAGHILLPCLLASCASNITRTALPDTPRVDKLAQLSMPSKAIGLTTEGEDQGSDVISTQGRSDLIPTPMDDSDPLPKYTVPWLSFVNTPLQDVLQAIATDAKIALSVVWDNPSSKISRSSVSMTHLSGDLTSVLNKLADSYGFYWRYKDGMLHITADRQYIAPVPPIADLYESLPIMVKTLGGTDVFLDKSARMITFRAGSQSFFKIRNYLEMTRKNRSLIVYDTYIWEVILNDASKMGIDWGALPGSVPATALTAGPSAALPQASNLLSAGLINAASGGTGLALSFAGSRFSMNLLIDFLRSQGTINSLSQPKIQLLSGGKAVLKDEIATTYVSRIGNPSFSAGTLIPGSVETSQVKTGVTLEVTGDVSDDTIYSDIALRVSDLLGMSSATVSGSTIALPKTASREVQTHVRAKPGDTILLAGIQYDKLQNTANTGMGMVKSNQADVTRSELIIVMRPRIKHFVPRGDDEKISASPVAVAAPQAMPAPASVEVVKAKTTVQQVGPQEAQANPVASSVAAPTPELMTTVASSSKKKVTRELANSPPLGIYMQLGAFGNVDNAQRLRMEVEQRLGWRREAGQSLSVMLSTQPNRPDLYRLLAGPFSNRQAADQWADRGQRIVGSRPILFIH